MSKESLIKTIRANFDRCERHYRDEYERSRLDTKFLYGEQWDDVAAAKKADGSPRLVDNRLINYKNQTINAIKKSDFSVVVNPVDSDADIDTAEIMQGLIRNIESSGNAHAAYESGAECAVNGGYGFIRLYTDYRDNESFDKEVRFKKVINPASVYLDPDSIELDGSDAEYAFIFEMMDKKKYQKLYPSHSLPEFEGDSHWMTGEQEDEDSKVRVAEFFYKERHKKTIYLLQDGRITDEEPEQYIDSRESQEIKVKWVKTNGQAILEETEFESQYIPVIPVYGDVVFMEGKRKVFSLIHHAKDPQRMLNYWKSKSTELVALQPKSPYIGAKGAFKSYNNKWQSANIDNPAFLEYDLVKDEDGEALAPPPFRERPPEISPAMTAEVLGAAEAIQHVLGIHDARIGADGQEISGVAIKNRQLQGDNATFHFADNFAASIRHVGRIIADIIPKIYDSAQIIRILGADKTPKMVPVNMPYVKQGNEYAPYDPSQGHEKHEGVFNLKAGKYDIVIEVGAQYATKRQEAVDTLLQLIQSSPELMNVVGDLLVGNMDIPDSQEIRKRIQSQMPPEVLGDDPQAAALAAITQEKAALEQELVKLQIAIQEKQDNQAEENRIKLLKLDIENKLADVKIAETQAKIAEMAGARGISDEIITEIGQVLNELIERSDEFEGAIQDIAGLIAESYEPDDMVSSVPESDGSQLERGDANNE